MTSTWKIAMVQFVAILYFRVLKWGIVTLYGAVKLESIIMRGLTSTFDGF